MLYVVSSGMSESSIMDEEMDASTWPELAVGLYDKLTGRGAEIT